LINVLLKVLLVLLVVEVLLFTNVNLTV